jgi:hypothetical protein
VTGDGSEDVIVGVALPGADALVRMAQCGSGCLERREQVQLSWWHGSGSGGFAARVDRAVGPAPNSLAFGTVGHPGPDLVVANTTAPFAQVSYLTNASQL